MKLDHATELANRWVERLRPGCTRIEVAGSILRQKQEVGDIDIVCMPVLTPVPDLFGDETGESVNELERLIEEEIRDENLQLHIDERGRTCNGPRHKKLWMPEEIKVELWIVFPPSQWGVIFAIRTGPAEYSHWFVTSRQQGGGCPSPLQVKDGHVQHRNTGVVYKTPEEKDFFELLQIPYQEPNLRGIPK